MTRVAGAVIDGAILDDRVAADADIAAVPRAAGAVDDAAAAQDEIVGRRLRRDDGREEKQQSERPGTSHNRQKVLALEAPAIRPRSRPSFRGLRQTPRPPSSSRPSCRTRCGSASSRTAGSRGRRGRPWRGRRRGTPRRPADVDEHEVGLRRRRLHAAVGKPPHREVARRGVAGALGCR